MCTNVCNIIFVDLFLASFTLPLTVSFSFFICLCPYLVSLLHLSLMLASPSLHLSFLVSTIFLIFFNQLLLCTGTRAYLHRFRLSSFNLFPTKQRFSLLFAPSRKGNYVKEKWFFLDVSSSLCFLIIMKHRNGLDRSHK